MEIVNKKEVRPVAHKFKQLIGEVREQVKELKKQPLVKDEETGEYVETPLRELDVERFLQQCDEDLEKSERGQAVSIDSTINRLAALKNKQAVSIEEQKIAQFEKNFGKKLKKLTKDTEDPVADAKNFILSVKNELVDFRSTVRNVVDKLRSDEYETFARLGMDRKKPGEDAYKKIEQEKRMIKERLKRLGNEKVLDNNWVSDSEESEGGFYENESDHEGQIPGSMPGEPTKLGPAKIDRSKTQVDPMVPPMSSRGNSQSSQRDLRVRNTSLRAQKQKRTTLMGANKPHLLANQNEEIKRMLGLAGTLDEKESKMTDSRVFRETTGSKKSFSNLDSQMSHASVKKAPMRASSQIRPLKTQINTKAAKKEDSDSDWEIEHIEDMVEKMELNDALEDLNEGQKKGKVEHKHNFLYRYLEHAESQIKK